jgi:ketosteroid isomerase-like protein
MTDEALQAQAATFERCIRERDEEAAKSVLHDDFALILVEPAPVVVMSRVRWLEVLREYVVHHYEVQHQHLDVASDCAAVLQRVDIKATVMGEQRNGILITSDIWRYDQGEWRVWRRHSTPLSAGRIPGANS